MITILASVIFFGAGLFVGTSIGFQEGINIRSEESKKDKK